MAEKKGGSRQDRDKRNSKLMIYLISAIMLFSGIYLGVNESQPTTKEKTSDYSSRILQYTVYPIGNISVPVMIDGNGSDVILMFTQSGYLDQESVRTILNENITGVSKSTFEVSGAYNFFRFTTETPAEAERGVKSMLRTRAYVIYNVYPGVSSAGKVSIIGSGLRRGDYVKALLFQRSREGVFDLVGFSQGVIPYGYVVRANLTNVTGFLYNGVLKSYFNESSLNRSVVDLSELRLTQPRVVVHAVNYSVGFNATVYYEGNITIVEGMGLSGLIGVVQARNISYERVPGRVSFILPLDSDLNAVGRELNASGVTNVSSAKIGVTVVPPEITDGKRIIRVSGSNALDTIIEDGSREGDEINVSLSIVSLGEYNLVFARQV